MSENALKPPGYRLMVTSFHHSRYNPNLTIL